MSKSYKNCLVLKSRARRLEIKMSKVMKNIDGETRVAYVEPYVKNYDLLLQKVDEINSKFEEIQKLTDEIENMEYPIELRTIWQKENDCN